MWKLRGEGIGDRDSRHLQLLLGQIQKTIRIAKQQATSNEQMSNEQRATNDGQQEATICDYGISDLGISECRILVFLGDGLNVNIRYPFLDG